MCAPVGRVVAVSALLAGALLAGALLSGCGQAGRDPGGAASSSPAPTSPPGASATVPPPTRSPVAPGQSTTLGRLGFQHGPLDSFPVPVSAVVTVRVDQPNVVTLVLTGLAAEEVFAFYRHALTPAGFRIEQAASAATTLTFAGQGWSGSVTGQRSASAVVLHPD